MQKNDNRDDGHPPSAEDWERTIAQHEQRGRAFVSMGATTGVGAIILSLCIALAPQWLATALAVAGFILVLATLVLIVLFAREFAGRQAAEMAYFVADRRETAGSVDTDPEEPR